MDAATAATPRTSTLRAWQSDALEAMRTWESGPFLISAAPGAGKTRPALVFAREQLRSGAAKRVVVVAPTTPLTRQWADAAADLGVHLAPDSEHLRPPRDFDGVSATYARVASAAERWSKECGPGTLVIADEAHHLGDELSWGLGFKSAFGSAVRWLLLSGTPFRSDASPIPGVVYDAHGVAMPDVTYTYADAVRDEVCRPVTFVPYDGTLQWQSGDEVIEAGFDDALTGREASRRYRTAISVELPDGLPRILATAHSKLLEIRAGGHRDAGGLCVAADSEHARAIAELLKQVTGKAPLIVLHTESDAAAKLKRFTASREDWIVAVNMVSEGVDIPRLRVGVYATAAKTPMIFRQIVGRFVRTIPGRPVEESWLYLPGDPVLRRHATEVETELSPMAEPGSIDDPLGLDELPDRVRSEESPLEFVALSADVAPTSQMSLFGGPAAVVPYAPERPLAPAPAATEIEEPEIESVVPLHERRKALRAQRSRLVGELRRRDGRRPQEINAWLNRQCGVGRVEEATLEQLERSIELLLAALTARR